MSQNIHAIPKLEDLVVNPDLASLLPAEAIPAMLGELERLRAALWVRLTVPQNNKNGDHAAGDRLLDVKEAAAVLHSTADYLYRHSTKLPFAVRMGRKVLFSEAGIERYIRQRAGRQ